MALGIGLCPFGVVPAGFGQVNQAPNRPGVPLEATALNHITLGARQIDPTTRDYVFDSNGRLAGMSATAQQVFLSVVTTVGTSAIPTLGSGVGRVRMISDNYQTRIQNLVQVALTSLIRAGQIQLTSVEVTRLPQSSVTQIVIIWTDLTITAQPTQTTSIAL